MGIELFFSNLLEPLVEKLSSNLDYQYQEKNNIFKAPLVVVPNTNLAKWIKLQLARENGILMNINFQYLESGLWSLLELLDPNEKKALFLEPNLRQMIIFYLLGNIKNDREDLNPLADYLKSGKDQPSADYSKRLWQLSEKLAVLFQEYEFHRLEMIHNWLEDIYSANPMEICQQKIYSELSKIREKYFTDSGSRYLSLMEYSDKIFSWIESQIDFFPKSTYMHLFGFSNISPCHLDLIKKLSRFHNILIYSVNPCMEFWEDTKTPRENRWLNRKISQKFQIKQNETEEPFFSQASNPLLSLWGKPGREGIRNFCRLVDYDFNSCYVMNNNCSTVLENIQNQVLTFQDRKDSTRRIFQDSSLQIIACPSRFREVETVYNSILYNLTHDPDLKLTDIAIQVPEISIYKPFFDAVFGRNPKAISCNLVDAHAEIESMYGKAIIKFLELVSGRFSRHEIFELLLNPCFMQKWELSIEDIQIFAEWSQALNIFHSFDRASKIKKGYPDSDMYTWKQGLIRLKLARIFSDPADSIMEKELPEQSFPGHFHGKTPYADINTGDIKLIEKFCLIIETLHQYCETFSKGPYTGEKWKYYFLEASRNLLSVPEELNSEKTVQKTLFKSLDELGLYDRITKSEINQQMDFLQFKEFIKSRLGAIWGGFGDYLTSGVTISALLPMRPIPFKIVYVMGMQEGSFPGKPDNSSLDLRLSNKKPWDITIPERNCYLFLELLLSVRKKLYISYVSKDLQKDQILQPCSVVNQLRRYIESEILVQERPFKIVNIPLKGSSAKFYVENDANDYSDVLINYSRADRIIHYREKGLWPEVFGYASEQEKQSVESFFPDFSVSPTAAVQPEAFPEKLTIRQLGRFLKDPVKESIQRHMLLYDQEETVEDITFFEDEPFYGRFPTNYLLKMEPLRQWIDHLIIHNEDNIYENSLYELFQKFYEKCRLQNQTPEGAYELLDLETTRQKLDQWVTILKPLLTKMLSAQSNLYHGLYVGETMDRFSILSENTHLLRFPELRFNVSTLDKLGNPVRRDVEIHGSLPWMWKDDKMGWNSLILTGSEKKQKNKLDRYLIEPVLTSILIRCLESGQDFFGGHPITFHLAYLTGIRSWNCKFTREDALDYIKMLVSRYLNPHMRLWLPFDAVIDAAAGVLGNICVSKGNESFKEDFLLKLSSAMAETEDPVVHLSGPEIGSMAIEESCNRFGIFFKNLSAKE